MADGTRRSVKREGLPTEALLSSDGAASNLYQKQFRIAEEGSRKGRKGRKVRK